jgi:hypothetical protein
MRGFSGPVRVAHDAYLDHRLHDWLDYEILGQIRYSVDGRCVLITPTAKAVLERLIRAGVPMTPGP